MRMRRKKYLNERLDACRDYLLDNEGKEFFRLSEVEKQKKQINYKQVFESNNKIALDIGCGKGAFVLNMAQLHNDTNFLAIEKVANVLVEACEKVKEQKLPNVKFLNCGAENLHYFLPAKSVDTIYLNFSCPYPKNAYVNRRLTNVAFLEVYKQILKDDGVIIQKTDKLDFFEYSIQQFEEFGATVFDVTYDLHNSEYKEGNVVTEYESRFLENNQPIYQLKAKLN